MQFQETFSSQKLESSNNRVINQHYLNLITNTRIPGFLISAAMRESRKSLRIIRASSRLISLVFIKIVSFSNIQILMIDFLHWRWISVELNLKLGAGSNPTQVSKNLPRSQPIDFDVPKLC